MQRLFLRPVAGALAALIAASAHAQTLSDADRANLQIHTAHGNPVHMGDTLDQVRAALPSAPAPQIVLGHLGTLWDQVDGIILRLYDNVVTDVLYDRKSQAKLPGLDVGIESPLADLEQALGASQPGVMPGTRAWPLNAKHQLVANVSATGIVTNLEVQFIPKPTPRPTTGVINWADSRGVPASGASAAPTPVLTGDERRAKLDELLAQRDDLGLLQLMFPQLARQPVLPHELQVADLAWLEAHAGESRPSVLYALSWKLMPADRERARDFNARARVQWQMAAAQCARPAQGGPLWAIFEGGAVADASPLRDEKPAWPIAFEQALAWDRALPAHAEADWFCGAGNVKAPADAAAARQAAWQRSWDINHPKTTAPGIVP
ncbi:hypothetical protein [Scleromatobacter humisilvae]|uniref:Uncharacterized protein n=1 Tax=Scleromatobacter humisilvae TaxID=2897159 RepID=A0A9X1YR52_9BURK|nr:hypothetical protein [Scleromatobacter humisilvae]MCK9686811.1 hypothetical protein [Scleromatobacter humisilvae]